MKNILINLCFICLSLSSFGQLKSELVTSFSKSYELEQYKEYTNAIDVLNKVYDANSYEVNLRLGWLHYLNGDYPKSLVYYKKATELSPRSIESLLGHIYPLTALGNEADIIKTYEAILKIDPSNSTANYQLAELYFIKKKFVEAEKYLQPILTQYPFTYNPLVLMARIKVSLGKVIEAKEMYYKALLYNPTDQVAKDGFESLR